MDEELEPYLLTGQRLLRRYKRENAIRLADQDVDPREFAAWLKMLQPFLARSSWRLYRLGAEAVMHLAPREARVEALYILGRP